jgi:hypothetical protein
MFEISGYRPTEQLTGVLEYQVTLEAVYAIRYGDARPTADLILIQ